MAERPALQAVAFLLAVFGVSSISFWKFGRGVAPTMSCQCAARASSMAEASIRPVPDCAQGVTSLQQEASDAHAHRDRPSPADNVTAFIEHVDKKVEGWVGHVDMYWTYALTAVQRAHGVKGTVGEIGVHHGKYFSIVASTASPSEGLWACDLFDAQAMNVDGSGRGDLDIFKSNMNSVLGVDFVQDRFDIVSNSSLLLGREINLPSDFRFFSVDGGHTEVITWSDLLTAATHIVPGAVVVVDDYNNPAWPGVSRGVQNYFHTVDRDYLRLRPVVRGANKIFFTTASHHSIFLEALEALINGTNSQVPAFLESARAMKPNSCSRHSLEELGAYLDQCGDHGTRSRQSTAGWHNPGPPPGLPQGGYQYLV